MPWTRVNAADPDLPRRRLRSPSFPRNPPTPARTAWRGSVCAASMIACATEREKPCFLRLSQGGSKRLTNRQLLARIPKTGAAAKDLVCDRVNGLPCRYAPVYDKDRLELWLCGEPILSLKKHCRQTELLEAFQFAGWPHSLTDPLGTPSELDPENGLSDIISALKGRQGSRGCGSNSRARAVACIGRSRSSNRRINKANCRVGFSALRGVS